MKRGIFIAFVFLIIFSYGANALIGITPAIYEVDFKPHLKQSFSFRIIGDDYMKFKSYAEGDLAKYVTVSPKSLSEPGTITATISFPENIDVPGMHTLFIGARQLVTTSGGIALVGNIKGIIRVRIPYPDEYAEVSLSATNANAGNPVNLHVKIDSLGKNGINTKTTIYIYNMMNKSIASLPLGTRFIESMGSTEYEVQLNTKGYIPGYYRAEAIVEYTNRTARAQQPFRLGELFVNVSGYSNDFERGKINKMTIDIESFWNDPIEDVYATVDILNHSLNFDTNKINLEGFQKLTLTGYFDTSQILEDEFYAKITLHYQDRTNERTVLLWFKRETNYLAYVISGAVIALIGGGLIIFLWMRRRKNERKKKKRK